MMYVLMMSANGGTTLTACLMQLQPAVMFSHAYGNNLGKHHLIWRIPVESSPSDMLERNKKAAQSIKDKVDVYHTDFEDPSIVCDLRELNKGRPEKYSKFWEECK